MADFNYPDVLVNGKRFAVDCADNLLWLKSLPDNCASLTLCSPPYMSQRTYGIDFEMNAEQWVAWMIPRVVEMCRVTAGLVCINMSAPCQDHVYQPAPEMLVADLVRHHGVVCGPSSYCYFRFGIPGSGHQRYHRRDWEPVYCFARPENLPLAWADNTALGHPPKWAPGGEMSNRLGDGRRRNQLDGAEKSGNHSTKDGSKEAFVRPSHVLTSNAEQADATPGLFGPIEEPPPGNPWGETWGKHSIGLTPDGTPMKPTGKKMKRGRTTKGSKDGDTVDGQYDPPVLANPGNVIREKYDAEQVRQLLDDLISCKIDQGDVFRALVGGGMMGSKKAHDNEAPMSLTLAEFFVRSYCPPGGICIDPFCGSGTTGHAALMHGRKFLGCDIRESQVKLSAKRLADVTPDMFAALETPS